MRFPAEMVEAIAAHHSEPQRVASRLGRLLIAADAVALEVDGIDGEENVGIGEAFDALEIAPSARHGLVDEVRRDQANLRSFLNGR